MELQLKISETKFLIRKTRIANPHQLGVELQ